MIVVSMTAVIAIVVIVVIVVIVIVVVVAVVVVVVVVVFVVVVVVIVVIVIVIVVIVIIVIVVICPSRTGPQTVDNVVGTCELRVANGYLRPEINDNKQQTKNNSWLLIVVVRLFVCLFVVY